MGLIEHWKWAHGLVVFSQFLLLGASAGTAVYLITQERDTVTSIADINNENSDTPISLDTVTDDQRKFIFNFGLLWGSFALAGLGCFFGSIIFCCTFPLDRKLRRGDMTPSSFSRVRLVLLLAAIFNFFLVLADLGLAIGYVRNLIAHRDILIFIAPLLAAVIAIICAISAIVVDTMKARSVKRLRGALDRQYVGMQ